MNEIKVKFVPRYYFAYGSNLHIKQMKRRCPDATALQTATLRDYDMTFRGNRRGVGVMDVIPKKGKSVEGAIYKVSFNDLKNLDRYEGYPTLYKRYEIDVELEDGTIAQAFVYRMLDEFLECPPNEHYFEIILEGYRQWGLDSKPLFAEKLRLEKGV